jgi:ketosteroid isomerase-like protein
MHRAIAMFFALRTLLAPSSPLTEVPNLSTPEPPIVKVSDAYVKAMLAPDTAAVAALYEEDAVEMPACQPLIKGRAAIEQYFRDVMKSLKPDVQ